MYALIGPSILSIRSRYDSTASRGLSSPARIRRATSTTLTAAFPAADAARARPASAGRRSRNPSTATRSSSATVTPWRAATARRKSIDGGSDVGLNSFKDADLRVPVRQVRGSVRGVPLDVGQAEAAVPEVRIGEA